VGCVFATRPGAGCGLSSRSSTRYCWCRVKGDHPAQRALAAAGRMLGVGRMSGASTLPPSASAVFLRSFLACLQGAVRQANRNAVSESQTNRGMSRSTALGSAPMRRAVQGRLDIEFRQADIDAVFSPRFSALPTRTKRAHLPPQLGAASSMARNSLGAGLRRDADDERKVRVGLRT